MRWPQRSATTSNIPTAHSICSDLQKQSRVQSLNFTVAQPKRSRRRGPTTERATSVAARCNSCYVL